MLKQAYGPIATLFDIFMRPKNLIYHMQFTLEVGPPNFVILYAIF